MDLNKVSEFSAILLNHLSSVFEPVDGEDKLIDLEQVSIDDNTNELFYALGSIVPWKIYKSLTGEDDDVLSFNHLMNRWIVEQQIEINKEHEQKS